MNIKLIEKKEKLVDRIESLQTHIANLTAISGEGRAAMAEIFSDKVAVLKQRVCEINMTLA